VTRPVRTPTTGATEMDLEYQYLVGKLQEALAADSRVNTLDIRIVVTGGKIHLNGEVPTEARRSAVNNVVAEVLPGIPVRNDITVLELHEARQPEAIDDEAP
jgi:osmotically-inducible protein OsmY